MQGGAERCEGDVRGGFLCVFPPLGPPKLWVSARYRTLHSYQWNRGEGHPSSSRPIPGLSTLRWIRCVSRPSPMESLRSGRLDGKEIKDALAPGLLCLRPLSERGLGWAAPGGRAAAGTSAPGLATVLPTPPTLRPRAGQCNHCRQSTHTHVPRRGGHPRWSAVAELSAWADDSRLVRLWIRPSILGA